MSCEEANTLVMDDESLARFILFSKWIRADQTVKPDAFVPRPYPDLDLSVTRHSNLAEQALWKIAQDVADTSKRNLYGRADIYASSVRRQNLKIEPAPALNNPNHANVIDWPADKSAQKSIAQQLAADSAYQVRQSA